MKKVTLILTDEALEALGDFLCPPGQTSSLRKGVVAFNVEGPAEVAPLPRVSRRIDLCWPPIFRFEP